MATIRQSASMLCHLAAFALVVTGCAVHAQPPKPASIDAFWSQFRSAVTNGSIERIEAFTAFPFATRGTLDTAPKREHDRRSFRRVLPALLDQDPGLTKAPESMRALIQRTGTIESHHIGDSGKAFRVGTFRFEFLDGKWQFVSAYTDE